MLLSIPCLPGAVLFKLSLSNRVKYQLYQECIPIKFNRKMKPGNDVILRWQMKMSAVNYNHLRKN